jgi:WD40 repeat protein
VPLLYIIENWSSHLTRVIGAKVDEAQRDDELISTTDPIDIVSDPDTNSHAKVDVEATEKRACTGAMCITFSPDGRCMAIAQADGSIRLRDSQTGKAHGYVDLHVRISTLLALYRRVYVTCTFTLITCSQTFIAHLSPNQFHGPVQLHCHLHIPLPLHNVTTLLIQSLRQLPNPALCLVRKLSSSSEVTQVSPIRKNSPFPGFQKG